METLTAEHLVRAGALKQICNYHWAMGRGDADWPETRLYAIRTFRDVPVPEIDRLIAACQLASRNARRICNGEEVIQCGILADLLRLNV